MLIFNLKLFKCIEIWYNLRKYFLSDHCEYLVIKLSVTRKVEINLKMHKIRSHGDESLTVI